MHDQQTAQTLRADDGESYPDRIKQAESLSNQLLEVETATTSDGNIRATVTNIEHADDHSEIVVRVETPLGNEVVHRFDPPEPWTGEYPFVRWVRENGGAAGDLESMIGGKVPVSDSALVVPDAPVPLRDRLRDRLSNISVGQFGKAWFVFSMLIGILTYWAFLIDSQTGMTGRHVFLVLGGLIAGGMLGILAASIPLMILNEVFGIDVGDL